MLVIKSTKKGYSIYSNENRELPYCQLLLPLVSLQVVITSSLFFVSVLKMTSFTFRLPVWVFLRNAPKEPLFAGQIGLLVKVSVRLWSIHLRHGGWWGLAGNHWKEEWWCDDMDTLLALLNLFEGNLPVISGSPPPSLDLRCHNRADFRLAHCQWESVLQSNAVSHWLGANLESALHNAPGLAFEGSSSIYAFRFLNLYLGHKTRTQQPTSGWYQWYSFLACHSWLHVDVPQGNAFPIAWSTLSIWLTWPLGTWF